MKIFLLKLWSSCRGNQDEEYNVYSSLDKAINAGVEYFKNEFKNFLVDKDNIGASEEKMMKINEFDYYFEVTEIADLEYTENFDMNLYPKEEYLKFEPTHKIYSFKYNGELENIIYAYKKKNKSNSWKASIKLYPEDFEEGAGEKFKVGDIVKLSENVCKSIETNPDKLYIVRFLPRRIEGQKYFENTYGLISTFDNEVINGLFTEEYYEKDIIKYDGEIDSNSPIGILQKIIKGEIKISNNTWQLLKNGEISFDTRENFSEFKNSNIELKEQLDKLSKKSDNCKEDN